MSETGYQADFFHNFTLPKYWKITKFMIQFYQKLVMYKNFWRPYSEAYEKCLSLSLKYFGENYEKNWNRYFSIEL